MGKRLKVSISEQGGNQRQGRSDDNSSGAAKPWDGGNTDGGSAKPWSGAQNNNSSSGGAKPWGSSGGSGFSNGFSSSNGKGTAISRITDKDKDQLANIVKLNEKSCLIGTRN